MWEERVMKTKDRATKPSNMAAQLGWRNDLISTEILSYANRYNTDKRNTAKGNTTRPFGGYKKRAAE